MFFRSRATTKTLEPSAHGSETKTKASRLGAQAHFRQQFALYFSEEMRPASGVGAAFSMFVFAVYVRTLYPSGELCLVRYLDF